MWVFVGVWVGWVGVAALASRSADLGTKVGVTVLIKDCQLLFLFVFVLIELIFANNCYLKLTDKRVII